VRSNPVAGDRAERTTGRSVSYEQIGVAAIPSNATEVPADRDRFLPSDRPRLGIASFGSHLSTTKKEVNEVQTIRRLLAEFPRREDGQTMAEYGVVLAVITIAVFGALALLSGNIVGAISRVAGYIT